MSCMSTYVTTAYQMFWVCGAQAHVSYISPLKMYSLSLHSGEALVLSPYLPLFLNNLYFTVDLLLKLFIERR